MSEQAIMITISIDYENNGLTWWNQVVELVKAGDAPAPLALLFGNEDAVTLPAKEASSLLDWASKLDGWNEGDERAPHPLMWT